MISNRRATLIAKAAMLVSWELFVIAAVLPRTGNSAVIDVTENIIGVAGLSVTLLWVAVGDKWWRLLLLLSAILVAQYTLQLGAQLWKIYGLEPDNGVWVAIQHNASVYAALFWWQGERYGIPWAFLALYRYVLMLPTQIVLIILVWLSARRDKVSAK